MKNYCFIIFLIITISCNKENSIPENKNTPEYYLNNAPFLNLAAQKYKSTSSLNEVAKFMKTTYNVDFKKEFNQLRPYITKAIVDIHTTRLSSSSSDSLNLSSINEMFAQSGIPKTSNLYQYFHDVNTIFQTEALTSDQVIGKIISIRDTFLADNKISTLDKNTLSSISNMLILNYEGITAIANDISTNAIQSGGRKNCWLCNAWRVIRSVVSSITAVAIIGASIGFGVTSFNPYGAAVGGMIGGVVGTIYAMEGVDNNICYGAWQCSPDGESDGMQNCETGDCIY